MKYDFSGYVTKNDIKCADGRTIRKNAFLKNDGTTVPLVDQHFHADLSGVLGHVLLENREDGVYGYGSFNNTSRGQNAKELVMHGSITAMSIFANNIIHGGADGADVVEGTIREVSLVISGANPEAKIDNVMISHSDGSSIESDEEVIIHSGMRIEPVKEDTQKFIRAVDPVNNNQKNDFLKHAIGDGRTIEDIFGGFSEEQKSAVWQIVGDIVAEIEGDVTHSNDNIGGEAIMHNLFEGGKTEEKKKYQDFLTHDNFKIILEDAQKCGSFKESFLSHAQTYGIENIDYLFPDAKTVNPTPDWIKRDTGWVGIVLNGVKASPFSRIKSLAADITADEARAKGYVKGNLKKEEVFKLLKRITTPTTIYKKQKLDRDDIIDVTTLDVVAWMKAEMRMMLDEERARAILVGDGREVDDNDKINEEHIRPIWTDDDMYAHHVTLEAAVLVDDEPEHILRSKKNYKGSGSPVLFTTTDKKTDWLLLKDKMGRRLYSTDAELASALGVSSIVEVPVMEKLQRTNSDSIKVDLLGIIVNLNDYVAGADAGGQISMFDDFDIDYNQYIYLIEGRQSGALIRPKSAIVIEKKQSASVVG